MKIPPPPKVFEAKIIEHKEHVDVNLSVFIGYVVKITYLDRCSIDGYVTATVVRRYSEFYDLYTFFSKEFPDMDFTIPPKVVLAGSSNLADMRMKDLELFLNSLNRIRGVLSFDILNQFFTPEFWLRHQAIANAKEIQNKNWHMNLKITSISNLDEQAQTFMANFRIEAWILDDDENIKELQGLMAALNKRLVERGEKPIKEIRFYWDSDVEAYTLNRYDAEMIARVGNDRSGQEHADVVDYPDGKDDGDLQNRQNFIFKYKKDDEKKIVDFRGDGTGFFLDDGQLCYPSLSIPIDRDLIVPQNWVEKETTVEPYITVFLSDEASGRFYSPLDDVRVVEADRKVRSQEDLLPMGNINWKVQMRCTFQLPDALNKLRYFPHDHQMMEIYFYLREFTSQQ
eukprot:UC4_evm1s1456